MTIDRHVYVGPYVRCVRKTEEAERHVRGCINVKCRRHRRPIDIRVKAYCSECGHLIGSWAETYRRDAVNVNDLLGDALAEARPGDATDEWVLLVPNVRRDPPRRFWVEGDYLFDALDMTPAAEVAWLDQAFADELAKLRGAFGADAVSVRWGVLAWTT